MPHDKPQIRAAEPKRHMAGVVVVVFLGFVFFLLIGLLIFTSARQHSQNAAARSETLTVLPPRIRIRTEPNAKAPVVVTAAAGEKLLMLEDRGAWVRVQDPDGLVGWAERGFLERSAERDQRLARFAAIRKLPPLQGVATQRTALYAGPGIFYPIIGELADGSAVKVFTRDHDFYAIDFNGEVAYADVDVIDVTATGAPQLDVATTATAAPPIETTASAAPPTTETETASSPAAQPAVSTPPAVPASADQSGVYAAVPPGGTQPEEIDRVVPRYPVTARAAGVGGAVVIRGIVRRDGRIDDVEIIRDLPYGLGEAARDAVEQWRFHPATFRGEPIDVYYTVTVNFRMR
jgi:TonB family protein